jgi:hypothetical protein
MNPDRDFDKLAERTGTPAGAASTRLKSRLFSALNLRQAAEGGLRSLTASKRDGHDLCVFENLVEIAPVDAAKSLNYCRVCHARILAERWEHAPIYWHGCPYVSFQKR